MANHYKSIINKKYTDKRTGEEKTRFIRPGATLFPIKDGDGFTLEIPEGVCLGPGIVHFRAPKPRAAGEAAPGEPAPSEDGDEIPF